MASHLDLQWEDPIFVGGRERLASFARVVIFDRRGTGLSDPLDRPGTLEQQMDDVDAVLDAVGMERVALFGGVEAGLCAMYAATHPDRVPALVLANVAVLGGIVRDAERQAFMLEMVEGNWGEGRFAALFAPSRTEDKWFTDWWTRFERAALSPTMARQLIEMNARINLRAVLPLTQAPTLVLHRRENPLVPLESGGS